MSEPSGDTNPPAPKIPVYNGSEANTYEEDIRLAQRLMAKSTKDQATTNGDGAIQSRDAEFRSLLLQEGLESDPRPSLIIDLTDTLENRLEPCHCNIALLSNRQLLGAVTDAPGFDVDAHAFAGFRNWAGNQPAVGALPFADHIWTQNTIRGRWRLIQGIPQNWLPRQPIQIGTPTSPTSKRFSWDVFGTETVKTPVVGANDAHAQLPDHSRRVLENIGRNTDNTSQRSTSSVNYDCTIPGSVKSTEHIDYMLAMDWASSPLGSMDTWDPHLKTMVNVVMDDPMPSILYIGPEYVMIYNEAFIPLMHKYHPAVFGTSALVTQKEYWKSFEGIIQHNIQTGKAYTHNHLQLFLRRNGILEETYFSFSFLPIVGNGGKIIAHYEPINETTREVISQRRMNTLLNAGQETAVVRDQKTFWSQVLECLHQNDQDVPFGLVYSVGDGSNPTASSGIETNPLNLPVTSRQCLFRGSIGLPQDHHAAYSVLDFKGDKGWAPFFRSALASSHPVVFHQEDHAQLREILHGIESRVFGDRITSVVISPITPTAYENILAFLVIGLNPRTPYNEDYQQFTHVASRLIETSLASVVLLEEEVRTRERMALQAAKVQQKLAEELETSRLEVERREQKFQRFAERANVGIFVLDKDGDYTYRNPAWFDIFQPAAEDINVRNAWLSLVEPEDVQRCEEIFRQLYQDKQSVSFELRLKRNWEAAKYDVGHHEADQDKASLLVSESRTWILCSAYPELSEDGVVNEVLGSVTDVSRQKFGEGLQKQRTAHALESKRRLENFIDTTSHEVRHYSPFYFIITRCLNLSSRFVGFRHYNRGGCRHHNSVGLHYHNPLRFIITL